MDSCAKCEKKGSEIFSRCGHIRHERCFTLISQFCPKCNIKISNNVKAEIFLAKLKSFENDSDEAAELFFCAEKIIERNPLFHKCKFYDESILEKFIKFGWRINDEIFGGPNLFYNACMSDDVEKVNLLIEYGLDLESFGSKGMKIAIKNSSKNVFDRLLQIGVKLKPKVIFDAIANMRYGMLEKILNEGVDANLKVADGITPILAAAKVGSVKMVQLLMERGSDFAAVDEGGNSIVHYACYRDDVTNLLQFLMDSGLDFTTKNNEGKTPLLVAIERSNLPAALFLARNKAAINECDKFGQYPLHLSANKDEYEILKALIFEGADVNVKNFYQEIPLQCVSNIYDEKEINDAVRLLLDHGADINALYKYDEAPLSLFRLYSRIDNDLKKRLIIGRITLEDKLNIKYNKTLLDLIFS